MMKTAASPIPRRLLPDRLRRFRLGGRGGRAQAIQQRADGISGSFTQTVQSKRKPKPRTATKSCARPL